MKKLFFSLFLTFSALFSYSQSYYSATKTELYTYDVKEEEWILYQKNSNVNITIVLEDEFLSIQANSPTMYKIQKGRGKEITGKSYTGFRYDAVDLKKNDVCSIDIIRFDDTNFMISVVKSQDYNLRYYLQAK